MDTYITVVLYVIIILSPDCVQVHNMKKSFIDND